MAYIATLPKIFCYLASASYMKLSAKVKALHRSNLFHRLSEDALESLAAQAKFRQFFPGETIVWQGKPSDSLFLITNGIVAVKKIMPAGNEHVFAYLMSGSTFGEVGILENQPRSATITALSDVDVLVLRREDFLSLLHSHATVAIELAKTLAKYLLEANRRQSRGNRKAKLIVIFDIFGSSGATTMGLLLAKTMHQKSASPTVYTEYPVPQRLVSDLDITQKTQIFNHPNGFDVALTQEGHSYPASVRTTVLLDRLMNEYANVILTINDMPGNNFEELDENMMGVLESANQVLLFIPSNHEAWSQVRELKRIVKRRIRSDETSLFVVANLYNELTGTHPVDRSLADFAVPYLPDFPLLKNLGHDSEMRMPAELENMLHSFVDRLERTNQVAIFIPTTVDVDKAIDTAEYVERTLNFLAERFGGATSKEAQGVWNSDEVGLVGEKVFLVHTYCTQADMNRYMDEIVEYVKALKIELRQEAMALEVNDKLTLI